MKNKKIIKLISYAIFILLIFQLMPSTLSSVDGFLSHAQNSKVILLSGVFHTDAIYTGRESQKSAIQRVPLRSTSVSASQICVEDIFIASSSFPELPSDCRRVIRQSIPHYFNGGKYKNNSLAI